MVHLVFIKPGGVPDKLCIFPADESNKLETALSRDRWLVWPHHDSDAVCCSTMYNK